MIPRFGRAFLFVGCVVTASDLPPFEWGNWPLIILRLLFYALAWAMAYGALGSTSNAAGQGRRVATYPEPDGSALDYEPQDREERCDQCGTVSGCLLNGLCPMCYELNGGTHE